jgi:hypothetical protein
VEEISSTRPGSYGAPALFALSASLRSNSPGPHQHLGTATVAAPPAKTTEEVMQARGERATSQTFQGNRFVDPATVAGSKEKTTAALAKEAGMSERTYQQRRNIMPRDMSILTSGVPGPIGPARCGYSRTSWNTNSVEVRMQDPAYTRSYRLRNAPIEAPSTGPAATGIGALDEYARSWFLGKVPGFPGAHPSRVVSEKTTS